jgi:putative FmdB family regulatory protein
MVRSTMRQVLVLKCDFPEFARKSMPLYEYRCSSCGHQQEFLQKWSDAPLTVCTACGKETFSKLLSAAGFHLKGSGWYATDFKNSGKKPASKTESKGDSKGESSTGGETKGGGEGGASKKDASSHSCGAGACASCS